MPLKFLTKMRYTTTTELNPSTGTLASVQVYRANGLYDPDVTGVGHQPRGFDQLMLLYDHFIVLGANITVRFASRDVDTVDQICCIALRDSSTVETDMIDYTEQGTVVSGVCDGGAGSKALTLRMKVNPNKFLSRSRPLSDPHLKGSVTSDPSEQCFFHVASSAISSEDAGIINAYVIIDYIVALIEPKDLASS